MMLRTAIFLFLAFSLPFAHADDRRDLDLNIPYSFDPPPPPEPPPSRFEQPQSPAQQNFEWMQEHPNAVTDECERLRRKFNKLEGKPQRRWAAKQYYEKHCQQYFNRHQGY